MTNPPPPRFPDTSTRDDVRELLSRCGYRESKIRERLGVEDASRLRTLADGILQERIDRVGGPLGTLLRLFLLAADTPFSQAEAHLGTEATEALEACGLIAVEAERVRPIVELWTVEELIVAADLRERHEARVSDFVLPPSGVTLRLAGFMMRRPGESVLDLGCGSGGLAALAAAHAGRVLATDVNPRAVAFARFNAELNGLEHMEVREGSLFDPVEEERFDRILCNPPYVISPEKTYVYRDGGTKICRRIVREAPDHLRDEGCLQMLVEWPERAGSGWQEELAEWLDGVPCDAWALRFYSHDPWEHAHLWLRQEYSKEGPPPEAVRRWVKHLERLEVESVGGGLIVLRASRRGKPIRTLREAPPMSPGPVGSSLAAWISAQTLLASIAHRRELLDTPLAPASGLEHRVRSEPTGDGWSNRSHELRLRTGLRFGAKVDPVAREIVGLLDGERTPREALELFAEQRKIGVDPFLDGLPGALASLLELGLLVPAGESEGPVGPDPD